MNYFRKQPERSYTYKGHLPYGVSELHAMDSFVDEGYEGNVPEEIVRNGGKWNETTLTLSITGGDFHFV